MIFTPPQKKKFKTGMQKTDNAHFPNFDRPKVENGWSEEVVILSHNQADELKVIVKVKVEILVERIVQYLTTTGVMCIIKC